MRIPLGAKPPISKMWEKGVTVAAILLVLVIIAYAIHPVLVDLIYFGVFVLVLAFVATCCLGLVDSAREALDYANSSSDIEGYNL